jgi:methanol--5-hydroxybenzimidazolylcobamide Co-methyltransferase
VELAYRELAIESPDDLIFGVAPRPLTTRRGLVIGGGTVYPELNFTLPAMTIDASTLGDVRRHYREMIEGALERAVALEVPGLVVEFETLPPMTQNPSWGMEVVEILLGAMEDAHGKHGLGSVFRMTPNDLRDMVRPPAMRSGELWESTLDLFEQAAAAGAELLSIESVGGKEVCDDALVRCDLPAVIFAQCVLGVRDMDFLWTHLREVAEARGAICAGDSACGFANTAMVLADKRMIPRVFAAVVRAVSAVRSLVAFERGAVGPGKDCAYENPILKAITGCPMAMEGKTAAVAHGSPLGNIAAMAADTWSNESVENVKLLGGMAPVCSLEQLAYDCRLMNEALASGRDGARTLRDWLVRSDARLDPQAFVLTPDNVLAIASAIVAAPGHYEAGVAAADCAIRILRGGLAAGRVRIAAAEGPWLDTMERAIAELPADEDAFIDRMLGEVDTGMFRAQDYGIAS